MDFTGIIIIGGVVVLLIAALAWVWDHLHRQANHLEASREKVLAHVEQRRDTVPYLLESYWGVHPKSAIDTALIAKRAEAREACDFNAVWKCEEELEALLDELWSKTAADKSLARDLGWMEARTDILQETDTINDLEGKVLRAKMVLENRLKKFPFVLFKTRFKIKT